MAEINDARSQEYALSHSDASWLAGIVMLPTDLRGELLAEYAERFGTDAIVNLFAQFIGMANSVVENCRTSIEIFAIVDGDMHPNTAEKLNLPTIFGAVAGAMLASGIDPEGTCAGCAFRLGTHANQSATTTADADWCGHPGERPFMCHEALNEQGEPTRGCVGFARLRANRKAA